jgi:uncharacterized protein (TIGR03382 family)
MDVEVVPMSPRALPQRALPLALTVGLTLGLPCAAFELRKDSQGDVVSWSKHVEFVLDAQLAIQLKDGHADAAVKAAVAELDSATATRDVTLRVGTHQAVGYVAGTTNQNDIFVLEDWPYDEKALAATVITINAKTNEIIDADIVFNAHDHHFRVVDTMNGDDKEDDLDDVQNTLTHELGHALGLMHNQTDEHVVMYPSAAPFETSKRVLATDDRDGLVALYAASAIVPETTVPQLALGCSSTSSSGTSALALMVAASMLVLRRRRRAALVVAVAAPLAVMATEPGARDVPDLAAASRVSVAEVASRTSLRLPDAPGLIVTDVQFVVKDCVKGPCGQTFTVRMAGGRVGDLEQVVAHQPVPTVSERVVIVQGARVATVLRLNDPVQRDRLIRAFSQSRLTVPVSVTTHVSASPLLSPTQLPTVAP